MRKSCLLLFISPGLSMTNPIHLKKNIKTPAIRPSARLANVSENGGMPWYAYNIAIQVEQQLQEAVDLGVFLSFRNKQLIQDTLPFAKGSIDG